MKEEISDSRRSFIKSSATAFAGIMIVPRYVLGGTKPDGTFYIPPSDLISLGIIGCGKQSRILSNFFLNTKEVKINAIAEVYQAKALLLIDKIKGIYDKDAQLGRYSDIQIYNDFRQLLDRKDIDAVVISSPDHWHAAMAVRAAEAGKDIYCEKPLSLTVKEGRAMVNATRKNKRVFQTGNMQRSSPEFQQAIELIRNGYIGDLQSIKVNIGAPPIAYNLPEQPIPDGLDWKGWLGPNESVAFNDVLAPPITKDVYPNWRLYKEFGGGMVTDWGAHMFDIAQWALDMDQSGPVEVIAPDGKEHPFLTYKYDNGVIMTHEKWEWNNAVLFKGTKGELRVGRRQLETSDPLIKNTIIADADRKVFHSENHYKNFLNAMRTRNKPVCDVEIGHRTASVCNIGNIAYQLKRPLKWNPKTEQFKNDAEANALLGRPMNNEWKIKL